MSTGRNTKGQGGAQLQNHNYFVTESLNVQLKIRNGHKNPNNSYNFHDAIEFYERIS